MTDGGIDARIGEVAAHVLWKYAQPGGREPGSFVRHLMGAFESADADNTRRLACAFPNYGLAMALIHIDGGTDILRDMADPTFYPLDEPSTTP